MQRDGLFNFLEVDEWDKCINTFIVLKPLIAQAHKKLL